ncbi:MAG: VanZ family protein [Sedimentisphaerales bacterium]|nr:VanZ family protein [Sedimentisphaerales bacterium]
MKAEPTRNPLEPQRIQRRYFWIAILLIAVVLILTHIPQKKIKIDMTALGLDKILHLASYAAISLFAFLSVPPGKNFRTWGIVLGILFLVAAFDEITQPWFGRTCSLYDLAADAVGSVAVFLNLLCNRLMQPVKN